MGTDQHRYYSFIDYDLCLSFLSVVTYFLSVVNYNNKNQYANFQNQTYHQL